MRKNLALFMFPIFSIFLFFDCQKRPDMSPRPAPSDKRNETSARDPATFFGSLKPPTLVKLDTSGFIRSEFDVKPFATTAHAKHLADPMKFSPFPDQGQANGKTAVVGSRVCVLYPDAIVETSADLDRLPTGIPIPFGTIIAIIGDQVENKQEYQRRGMFHFQDNWNWFYRTTYMGKQGLVFGADLFGLNDSNEANRISARLYQTNGAYDAFYPVVGYHPLPSDVAKRIERDKLAFQRVSKNEYSLRGYRTDLLPDDMLALYDLHRSPYNDAADWNRKTPVFVTTDLAAHIQHLMFDRTLQYMEEAFFLPRLQSLTKAFLEGLRAREAEAGTYRETHEKAIHFFQVAEALLELAPDHILGTSVAREAIDSYRDKDRDEVLAPYPTAIKEEIEKIYKAKGFDASAVFSFKDGTIAREDYSQYKPRGHYTKNGALGAYFRAMMWFGRVHFLIADAGYSPLPSAGGTSSDSTALTIAMEPIALLITDLVRKDDKLYGAWTELFDPITDLIGISSDLSFKEVLPLWKDQKVDAKDFGAWIANRDNLLAFMKAAHDRLRPPAISSSSVWWGPSEGESRKPPMGWRLFGQRYTYDSAIHHQVSPPRLLSRDMVRGLDIMTVFGSRTAGSLLASSDYPRMSGLKERLEGLRTEFDAYNAAFWGRSYYSSVLFQVKAQATFEPGAGFYFTESPAWATKAMLSAHGTWSELRHDTLLYATQSAAERAGDGDFEPTFRTQPIPEPIHYLEPNLPFWQGSALTIQAFLRTLDKHQLLEEETAKAFGRLQEIYAKAAGIAAVEAQDKPVKPDDVKWIATIPSALITLVLVHVEGGDIVDENQLRMAIIADVFTNVERKLVLEAGVGIPYRMYVPLNDSQGGKRIAIGYVFSYYEFQQESANRMTDESWKNIVYGDGADSAKYQPFWAKGILLSPEPAKAGSR